MALSLSVRLSEVGVLLERLNIGSRQQNHTITQGLPQNSTGVNRHGGGQMQVGGLK